MYQNDYFVLKDSGTYANALEAFGLTAILSKIVGEKSIQILDEGSYFRIHSRNVITEELVKSTKYFQTMIYIKVKNDKPDSAVTVIDYDGEKGKRDNFNKFVQELKKQKPVNMNQQIENYQPKPNPDYDIFSSIYQLKALEGYKKVILNLFDNRDSFAFLLKELLFLYSEPEDFLEQSNKRLKALKKHMELDANIKVNSLQLFNPHQGKGVNEPKSNRLKNENLPSFWLREWMKMIGCYKAMTIKAIKISDKSWDSKIYVLCPKNIDCNQLFTLNLSFKPKLRGLSAVKLDISSLLQFCETFIKNIPEYKERKNVFSKLINPHHFINGFYTTYLKDLGQNKAVSNLSFLQLPTFIEIGSYNDGQAWIQIIKEHLTIINRLQETPKNPESGIALEVMQQYRQFITSSHLIMFLNCLATYGIYLMDKFSDYWAKRVKYKPTPFSSKFLEVLLMKISNKELLPILQCEGFKNIAAAIRKSTISLQYTPKEQRQYEVKYGIAQDLKRKSAYKNELIEYLAEFIALYNVENARLKEQKGESFIPRSNVKQQDIEEFIKLIDEYGSNIVGRLLAAYGYAFDRKEKNSRIK